MNTRNRVIILLTLALVLLFSANAITSTLLTGIIKLTVNETPVMITKSLGVKNENNNTVFITIIPNEDIQEIVSFETTTFPLEPNESRFVEFNISLNEPKDYSSKITVMFSNLNLTIEEMPKNTMDVVGMDMRLVVDNQEKPVNNTEIDTGIEPEKNNFSLFNVSILVGIVLIIILLIIKRKMSK